MARHTTVIFGSGTQWVRTFTDSAGATDAVTFSVPVSAPIAPFAVGSVAGVPTGTTLTNSTGLGTNDGTTSITLVNPDTGASNTFTVTRYYRRRWTDTINPDPAAGAAIMLEECAFPRLDIGQTNARNNLLHPLVVAKRCTLDGGNTSGNNIVEGHAWIEGCHLTGAEDGWAGPIYSVLKDSNVIATTDGQPDPHSDGLQVAYGSDVLIWHSWLDAGRDSASSNAPVRIGNEFGNVTRIGVHYSGLAGTQHGLQVRADTPQGGSNTITGLTVVGNRFEPGTAYGPTDFASVLPAQLTWSDNAFFDGTPIAKPI